MSDYWTRKEYIVRINDNKVGGGASGLRKKKSKVETQTGIGVCKQCGENVNECGSICDHFANTPSHAKLWKELNNEATDERISGLIW